MTQQKTPEDVKWISYEDWKFYEEYMKDAEAAAIFKMTGWLGKPFPEEKYKTKENEQRKLS